MVEVVTIVEEMDEIGNEHATKQVAVTVSNDFSMVGQVKENSKVFQIYPKNWVSDDDVVETAMVQNPGNLSMDGVDENSEVNAIEHDYDNGSNMAVVVVVIEIFVEENGKHAGIKA